MKILGYILTGAIIVALVWDNFNQRDSVSGYENQIKALESERDSITALQHKSDLEALRIATQYNLARQELTRQATISQQLTRKYNVLKSMAPRNLSDSAINAKVARLYPPR